MSSVPIVFIHYGNSFYLPYTLRVAKLYNPDKEIFLLGDKHNKYVERYGIKHVDIKDFMDSPEISTFEKVFQLIAPEGFAIRGKDNKYTLNDKGEFWIKFVFLKLFVLYNFAERNNIRSFWTFDTDNFILADLSIEEAFLRNYDNTEKTAGDLMIGFINNRKVLYQYICCINELFQDQHFIEAQKTDLANAPKHWAFTEMRAYKEFKNRHATKPWNLQTNRDGKVYDDTITFENGMEMHKADNFTPLMKRLFVDEAGRFFVRDSTHQQLIQTLTIDASWVPNHVIKTLAATAFSRGGTSGITEIKFKESLIDTTLRKVRFKLCQIKDSTF